MRLRIRMLWALLASARRRLPSVLDEAVLAVRVLPNDVDVSRMTNDRFLALMDLGRIDFGFRLGLARTMVRRRWIPLAVSATIRFRHALRLLGRYHLRTRVAWWDDHSVYFRQCFEQRGRVDATGYVRVMMLGPHGPVSTAELLAAAGAHHVRTPEKPLLVERLEGVDALLHEEQRASDAVGSPVAA